MSDRDEFYIGYLDRAPPRTAGHVRRVVIGLVALLLVVAGALAATQRPFAPAFFDFGNLRSWRGTVVLEPHPALLIEHPTGAGHSRVPLVGPFKSGAGPLVDAAAGRVVELRGTLIARDGQSMIEVDADEASVRVLEGRPPTRPAEVDPLGEVTLRGEIVDSKCFLGVMNPGETKVHRACATRCVSGGIPPVLLVRDNAGRPTYFMLVGAEGEMVNDHVLDLIAEPVEITGTVELHDDLLVLRADPASYQRL